MSGLCGTKDVFINQLPSYEYPALPEAQSFRVLELMPGEPDEPISVRLHLASWDDPPSYDALSYTWGDLNTKVPILCDGKRLECTPNLRSFLEVLRPPITIRKRRLWKPRRIIPKSRFLWADALCIDQLNTRERGHQVKNMIKIYQGASAVRVWLGSEHTKENARTATESVRVLSDDICGSIDMTLSDIDLNDNIYYNVIFPNSEKLPSVNTLPQPLIESLKWIFSSSWFTRLWVIQEVNSNPNCWVHFGNDTIEWIRVLLIACYIQYQTSLYQQQFANIFVRHAKSIGTYFGPKISIVTYLQRASHFYSADAKDKVYGLLGLIQTRYPEFPLDVDYERPILEVFIDLMELVLSHEEISATHSLSILHLASFDPSCDWPSWVVRWDQKVDSNLSSPVTKINAAPNTRATPVFDRSTNVLELRGVILDVVSTAMPFGKLLYHRHSHHGNNERIQAFRDKFLIETTTAPEGQDPIAACAMALACGTDSKGRAIEAKRLGDRFKAYLYEISGEYQLQSGGVLSQDASEFRRAMKLSSDSTKRCYFNTDTGYKGCTRQTPMPGDRVCILFGGKHVFILRPHRDGYLLIDHAYVYGVMNGEVMEDWKAGRLPHIQEQSFKIY